MSHDIITGAQGGQTVGADAPNRIEINDFVKVPYQFSLYIQALSKRIQVVLIIHEFIDFQIAEMFNDSQDDPTSHFGLG
jgi:hypothetical protein